MLKKYSHFLLLPEISVWLFVATSILSYHQDIKGLYDYEYGWPWPYYNWFYMDGELHCGSSPENLLADAVICVAITIVGAGVYQLAKRPKI